mgnify:FL=1
MINRQILFLLFFLPFIGISQSEDEKQLKEIYTTSLTNGESYNWLSYLSNQIGGRLSGSFNAEQAVNYTKAELDSLGLDRVWLQPVMVPKWTRGIKEFSYLENAPGETTNLDICALGGSVATPSGGLKANVIEVKGIEELELIYKKNNFIKSIFIF